VIVSQGRVSEKLPAPDLVNKAYKEAEKLLASLGLKVGKVNYQIIPNVLPNTVVDQFPRPGDMVANGGTVDLFVSQQGEVQKDFEEH
jgi:beta-lactam-binding protein with PASTA domain